MERPRDRIESLVVRCLLILSCTIFVGRVHLFTAFSCFSKAGGYIWDGCKLCLREGKILLQESSRFLLCLGVRRAPFYGPVVRWLVATAGLFSLLYFFLRREDGGSERARYLEVGGQAMRSFFSMRSTWVVCGMREWHLFFIDGRQIPYQGAS